MPRRMARLAVIGGQWMRTGFFAGAVATALRAYRRDHLIMAERQIQRYPRWIVTARMAGFAQLSGERMVA